MARLERLWSCTCLAWILTVAPAFSASPPAFDFAQGLSQVLRFEPSPIYPGDTVGYDAQGRVVFLAQPEATWVMKVDAQGDPIESVDEWGNRVRRLLDGKGNWVGSIWETQGAGSWRERTANDASGALLAQTIEGADESQDALVQKLQSLGLPIEGLPPLVQEDSVDPDGLRKVRMTNAFATVTVRSAAPGKEVAVGEVYYREKTELLGLSLEVSMENAANGVLIRDDRGGWRHEYFDDTGHLVGVEDAAGPLLSIDRDAEGRPTRIRLGAYTELRYRYPSDGGWIKTVVDTRAGDTVFSMESKSPLSDRYARPSTRTQPPQRTTTVYLPSWGPVFEWHPAYGSEGHGVAMLGTQPYALMLRDGTGRIWRSITPQFGERFMQDRIDYSNDKIVLHLATQFDREPPISMVLPRYDLPTVSMQTPPETSSSTPSPLGNWRPAPTDTCQAGCRCWLRRKADGTDELIISCQADPPIRPPGWRPPGGCGCPGNGGGGGGHNNPPGNPLSPQQLSATGRGQQKAAERLTVSADCRALFTALRATADGIAIVNNLMFRDGEGVTDSQRGNLCAMPGIDAWTRTGGQTVFLCRNFVNLGQNDLAIRVIHEALHKIGLRENPPDTSAMTSAQINLEVKTKCGL